MKIRNILNKKALLVSALWVILSAGVAESVSLAQSGTFRLPPANTRFENVTFVVFDTETTGFSPVTDRLVEIGAEKIRGGKVLDSKTWLINPKRYIPTYVQAVHGITPAMVKNAPTFEEVYPEFLAFIEGAVLVAHNAPFDVRFITASARRADMEPPANICLDSLKLFRTWYPNLKSYTLDAWMAVYGIDADEMARHRAEDDSVMVYLAMQREMNQRSDSPRFRDLVADAGGYLKFE